MLKRFALCCLCIQQEEVDAKAEELIPADVLQQIGSTNWKERLAGSEALTQVRRQREGILWEGIWVGSGIRD